MTSSPGSMPDAPVFADILAAAERLAGHAVVTKLIDSPALDAATGGRILVKPEMLQRTGSFKFRGAYNCVSRIEETARKRGVIAYSSGNHAQGVAAAARLHGIAALIVMPKDAPSVKIAATRFLGAEIVFYDRHRDSREAITERLAAERGATLVRPYDDPDVIAGQGTVGLEVAREAAERGVAIDAFLAPCGGGGLIGGCALALSGPSPLTKVYSVEPEGFDDTRRSLIEGKRVSNDPAARSICDALMAPIPGELTFAINRRLLAGGFAVSDAEAEAAMAFAFTHLKLVVEPGGAVALAAVLSGKLDCRGKTVAVVCSGGNVDPDAYRAALAGP